MARLTGSFAIKDLEGDRHFIVYEVRTRTASLFLLNADKQPRKLVEELVSMLNLSIAAIQVDHYEHEPYVDDGE